MKLTQQINSHELRSVIVSFVFVFTLMAAYYILRPLRDAMVSDWTNTGLSTVWSMQFFASLLVVLAYGVVVAKVRFKFLVPAVYSFFSLSFFLFYLAVNHLTNTALLDRIFYLWIAVFSLFHMSVFWSFMSDLCSKEQSKRLFGFIAVGASSGAICGPLLPALFASSIGTYNLVLLSSLLIALMVPAIFYLQRLKVVELQNQQVHADLSEWRIGGNLTQGFRSFFTNPYLLAIGGFIVLYTGISAFVYFEQKELLSAYSRSQRESILGWIEVGVNTLTLLTGLLATGRITTKFGLPITLIIVPFLMILGMLALALSPILTVLVFVQITRKAGNYAITRPAREMLFTHVDRETRFKAKPVIDIVAYRGGDMMMGWLFTGLTTGLGAGLAIVSLVGAGIAVLWCGLGFYLGLWFNRDELERNKLSNKTD